MYVLFLNRPAKTFLLRAVHSDASFDPPDGDPIWVYLDCRLADLAAGMELVRERGAAYGWAQYEVEIEDTAGTAKIFDQLKTAFGPLAIAG